MKETVEVFYEIVGVNPNTGQSTTRLVWGIGSTKRAAGVVQRLRRLRYDQIEANLVHVRRDKMPWLLVEEYEGP